MQARLLPAPGTPRSEEVAGLQITWTTPKWKVWRRIQSLKAHRDAFLLHLPAKAAEAGDALAEAVMVGCDLVVLGMPKDAMEPGTWQERLTARQVLDGCGDEDLVVSLVQHLLGEAGLSDQEKKVSLVPPASSPPAEDRLLSGTTTQGPPSDGPEAAGSEV